MAPDRLPVSYATPCADAVGAFAAAGYGLPGPVACTFLNRGFNDCFGLRTAASERFVLRVSGWRARGPADVAGETAFLAHLHGAGVPVAAAVPTRTGALFTAAPLPGGPRAAVLFHHAPGRPPNLDAPEDAHAQGVTLARLHDASDGWDGADAGRYRLDLGHLLHRPMAAVDAMGLDAPEAWSALQALASRLAERVAALDADLSRIRCHGDCHGLNARITDEGRAVFFDFDDGGYGYLAYDLAVNLWAQVSFGRRRHRMWHAFSAGYRTVRPVRPADERAIPLFVAIRHVWLMGEYASRTREWGSEVLSAAWLKREAAFLLGWERDVLAPALL